MIKSKIAPKSKAVATEARPMMKIKIAANGMGYVVGDGPCPFNPDKFLELFSDKLIEMQSQQLQEVDIPQEVVESIVAKVKADNRIALDNAKVVEMPQPKRLSAAILLKKMTPLLEKQQRPLELEYVDGI